MQNVRHTTDTESQKQADIHELLTLIRNSADPNKALTTAAQIIKKVIDARLTTEELAQVKGKAEEIISRRTEKKNKKKVEIGEQ